VTNKATVFPNIRTSVKTPVHFKSVTASCGCTAAQSQKDQVGPANEKGDDYATFNYWRSHLETQVKTVTVETDAAAIRKRSGLSRVIPQEIEISRRLCFGNKAKRHDRRPITVHAEEAILA